MTQNIITTHSDKIEIKNKNNEIIFYNDFIDTFTICTIGKVGYGNFSNIEKNRINKLLTTSNLLKLKHILTTSNNFIIIGIRNPIERNLSYFFEIMDYSNKELNECRETKKNNYTRDILHIDRNTFNKSIEEIITLYFNTDIHTEFNNWFEEFFEITGINQKTFNKTDGLDFYELPNNNKIMIYTLEKLDTNTNILNTLFRGNTSENSIINNPGSSQDKHYKNIYNNIKSQITYTQTYLDTQLNTDIMKFFYSDEDIQGFYNKYTVQN